jgi:hypothetical protein
MLMRPSIILPLRALAIQLTWPSVSEKSKKNQEMMLSND